MSSVKALVFTGYGLNCDYETHYALKCAGADPHRVHINAFILGNLTDLRARLDDYHILVFCGGFSWGDDHGAGVIMASKMRRHLGEQIARFIQDGKLILGICNGFQALVNLGLLPGLDGNYAERKVALTYNDTGNFIDTWVKLRFSPSSPCVFTKGLSQMDLPVRHGEGKFYASKEVLNRLIMNNQVVVQYCKEDGSPAEGQWPLNPNGSLLDIAGICDPTGRIFGLMPHPEAFNHFTNYPDWTWKKEEALRRGESLPGREGEGIKIFSNAVQYIKETFGLS
ncbi:MAG: phosphoribosylformylglycinamidine synthase I [Deltaproteobacteria bacterium]|nr:MAG: phosphoribosylformylglycinamidine synthase I [Deltaproteobacteria bacterium]